MEYWFCLLVPKSDNYLFLKTKEMNSYLSIHPLSIPLVRVVKLEPIPAYFWQAVGYTLDRSTTYRWANTESGKQTFTHKFTPMGKLE